MNGLLSLILDTLLFVSYMKESSLSLKSCPVAAARSALSIASAILKDTQAN